MGLGKIRTGDRTFFKPEEYQNSIALLIETHKILKDVPGNFGERDQAITSVTVFASKDDIENGVGTELDNCIIDKPYMVAPLAEVIGEQVAVKVGQSKPKQGQRPAWIWHDVAPDVEALIEGYIAQRDGELDDAPDF